MPVGPATPARWTVGKFRAPEEYQVATFNVYLGWRDHGGNGTRRNLTRDRALAKRIGFGLNLSKSFGADFQSKVCRPRPLARIEVVSNSRTIIGRALPDLRASPHTFPGHCISTTKWNCPLPTPCERHTCLQSRLSHSPSLLLPPVSWFGTHPSRSGARVASRSARTVDRTAQRHTLAGARAVANPSCFTPVVPKSFGLSKTRAFTDCPVASCNG